MPAVATEANRISRDYEVLKDKYDDLLKDREEMRLRGQVETERSAFQFEVIDPPTAPRNPAAPNRPLLLLGVPSWVSVPGRGPPSLWASSSRASPRPNGSSARSICRSSGRFRGR